ncbi:MAG: HD domain-containing protein [Clostridia bacterium]|nr:HD domain-containing protein [Clostridia bacterium]
MVENYKRRKDILISKNKMIDIIKAEKAFKEYLKEYDVESEKVALKVTHTYGVVKASEYLAKQLNLNEEDTNLSRLIALLHDIGRFEQSKANNDVYDNADTTLFDHAIYGCKVLFEDNMIRRFIEDDKYDNIIYKAILNHNRISIEEGLSEQELLHAKLIRDNDKTDNFRVKLTESFKVLLGTDDVEVINNEKISDDIYNTFMKKSLIKYGDTQTCLDRWSAYIAFIFDYNFDESLRYLKENDLVNKCFNRINYKNPDTIEKIANMRNLANSYIEEKCK